MKVGKELFDDLEKGLKNKNFKKREREIRIKLCKDSFKEIRAIELEAGFHDKKKNIFGDKYLK